MKLVVFSHKPCWRSAQSPTGFATDGGFPFQMKALSELFDSTVLVVPISGNDLTKGTIPLTGHHLRVVPLTMRRGVGLASKVSFVPWLLWNSRTILRELWAADAVHAPIPGDVGTVGMVAAWLSRKRLLVRYCGNWLTIKTTADRFWHWFMERFAGSRNVMLATGGTAHPPSSINSKIRWIFSTSLTECEINELGANPVTLDFKKLRLITVGRQEAGKGTDILLNALPLIREHYPDAVLDIVGDGSELPRLKQSAVASGIGDHVCFHGKVDHAEVLRLMRHAHIFCFPTHSEGFPKVVLEALASGLPVIATPVSAIPTLLSNGCGILIQPNPSAVAAAVLKVASSPSDHDRMSAKARQAARAFSLERWRDEIGEHLSAAWGSLRASAHSEK